MIFCITYFIHVHIAPGQGETTLGDNILKETELQVLSVWSLVACFKKYLCPLILCTFFHDSVHVHSPRAAEDNHLGIKFWCQQKPLVTSVICYMFQKNLFEVWFYTHFMILYMYIVPGQGQTSPWGQILISTERSYHFAHLLQVSKKSLGTLLFILFHAFIHVSSPGARADNP